MLLLDVRAISLLRLDACFGCRAARKSERSTYTKFHYAPLLLVGLLRWRLREPFALVAGQDPTADRLMKAVKATLADLRIPAEPARS